MGYSGSIKAIVRMRPFLDTLADNPNITDLEWKTDNGPKLAYQLREALAVVNKFKEQYPRYYPLVSSYQFSVAGNTVIARLKHPITVESVRAVRLTIPNAVNAMEVVGAVLSHKAPVMSFPNASMNPEELNKIKKWAASSDYIVEPSTSNGGLLLTHK